MPGARRRMYVVANPTNDNAQQWMSGLLRRHSADLRARVCRLIPASLRAEINTDDILQEVWFAAFQSVSKLRLMSNAEIGCWLRIVAQNKTLNLFRRATAQKRGDGNCRCQEEDSITGSDEPSYLNTPSRIMARREFTETVQRALSLLPDEQQHAVRLRLEGRTYQEIGQSLDRSQIAARSLAFRGVRLLRQLIPCR